MTERIVHVSELKDLLIEWRAKHGMTTYQAGRVFQVAVQTYRKWEYGGPPGKNNVAAIEEVLNISIDLYVPEKENRPKKPRKKAKVNRTTQITQGRLPKDPHKTMLRRLAASKEQPIELDIPSKDHICVATYWSDHQTLSFGDPPLSGRSGVSDS